MPVAFGQSAPSASHRDCITQQPGPFYNGNPSSSIWGNPPSSSSLWLNSVDSVRETYQTEGESEAQQVRRDDLDPDKLKPVFVFGLSSNTSGTAASSPRAKRSIASVRLKRHGGGAVSGSASPKDAAMIVSGSTLLSSSQQVPSGPSRPLPPPEPMITDEHVTKPAAPVHLPSANTSFTFSLAPEDKGLVGNKTSADMETTSFSLSSGHQLPADKMKGSGDVKKMPSVCQAPVSSSQHPRPFLSPINVSPATRITPVFSASSLHSATGMPVSSSTIGVGTTVNSRGQVSSGLTGRSVGGKDSSKQMSPTGRREGVTTSSLSRPSGTVSGAKRSTSSSVSREDTGFITAASSISVGNEDCVISNSVPTLLNVGSESVVFKSQAPVQVAPRPIRAVARGLQVQAGRVELTAEADAQAAVPEVLQQLRENYGWSSMVEDEACRKEGFPATGVTKSSSSATWWGAAERARSAVVPTPVSSVDRSIPNSRGKVSALPSKEAATSSFTIPGAEGEAATSTEWVSHSRGSGWPGQKGEGAGFAVATELARVQLGDLGINCLTTANTPAQEGKDETLVAPSSEQHGPTSGSSNDGSQTTDMHTAPFVFGASPSPPSSAAATRRQGSFMRSIHSTALKQVPLSVTSQSKLGDVGVPPIVSSAPAPRAGSSSNQSTDPASTPPLQATLRASEAISNPFGRLTTPISETLASASDQFVFSVKSPVPTRTSGVSVGVNNKKQVKSASSIPTNAASSSGPKAAVPVSLPGAEKDSQNVPSFGTSFLSSERGSQNEPSFGTSFLSANSNVLSGEATTFVFGAKPQASSPQANLNKARAVAAATSGIGGLSLNSSRGRAAPPSGPRAVGLAQVLAPDLSTPILAPASHLPPQADPAPPFVSPSTAPIPALFSESRLASEFVSKLQFTGFKAGEANCSAPESKPGVEGARRRTHTIHHVPLSQQRKKAAAGSKGSQANHACGTSQATAPSSARDEQSASTPPATGGEFDDAPSPMDVSPIQPAQPDPVPNGVSIRSANASASGSRLDAASGEYSTIFRGKEKPEIKIKLESLGTPVLNGIDYKWPQESTHGQKGREAAQMEQARHHIFSEEVGSPGTGEVLEDMGASFVLDGANEPVVEERDMKDEFVFGGMEGIKRAAEGEGAGVSMNNKFGAQEESKEGAVRAFSVGPRKGVRKVVRGQAAKRVEDMGGGASASRVEILVPESISNAQISKEDGGMADSGISRPSPPVAPNPAEGHRQATTSSKVEAVEEGVAVKGEDDLTKTTSREGTAAGTSYTTGSVRGSTFVREVGMGTRAKVGLSFSSTFQGKKSGVWAGRTGPSIGVLGHMNGAVPTNSSSSSRATVGTSSAEPSFASSQIPSAKLGDKKDSVPVDSVASKVSEMDCDKWRLQGNAAYAVNNFLRAEECYSQGVSIVSNNTGELNAACQRAAMLCYSNRAATRMAIGRMREALSDCMRAIAVDPNFSRVHLRVAICHLALGEREQARRLFAECTQQRSGDEKDVKASVEAAEGLRKVATLEEKLKSAAALLDKEPAKALPLIKEGLSISPHSEMLLEMKSRALLMTKQYEEVVKLCEQTLELAERNQPLSLVPPSGPAVSTANGNAAASSGSAALTPVRFWRWRHGARARYHLGKLEEALPMLESLASVDKEMEERADAVLLLPNSPGNTKGSSRDSEELHTLIKELLRLRAAGNGAFQAAKHLEAMEHYTVAINLAGDSRPFNAILFCNRAATFQALNQIADALADCSRAIALDPSYTKAISRRATLCEMVRDYSQAVSDLGTLVALLERRGSKRSMGGSPDLNQAKDRLSKMQEAFNKDLPVDHYLILGLEPSASGADVKKAYRKAALRHHPDKVLSQLKGESAEGSIDEVRKEGERLFKLIGEAHTVLSDVAKRASYDREEELRKLRNSTRMAAPDVFHQYTRARSFYNPRDTGFGYQQQRWRNEPDAAQPDMYARRRPRGTDFSTDIPRPRNRGGFDWEEM